MHPTLQTSQGCDQPSSAQEKYEIKSSVIAPLLTKDDFWGPVMPRCDGGAMMLVIKSGRSEIDESNVSVLHHTNLAGGLALCAPLRWIRTSVIVVEKEHVLRLKIGVGETIIVEIFDGVGKLVGDMTDLIHGIRMVAVLLEKVIYTFP